MDISGLTLPTSDISSELVKGTAEVQVYFWLELMGKTPVVSRKYHFMAF